MCDWPRGTDSKDAYRLPHRFAQNVRERHSVYKQRGNGKFLRKRQFFENAPKHVNQWVVHSEGRENTR